MRNGLAKIGMGLVLALSPSVRANSMAQLEAIAGQAKSFDAFVANPKLVDKYFTALKAYYGRDRFRCENFQRILDQVKQLRTQVPEVADRLWEKVEARGFTAEVYQGSEVSASGRTEWSRFAFRPIPRRFHGIWNDPSTVGCISGDCNKADAASPERWAILIRGSLLFHLEKNDIYKDVGVLVVPLKKKDKVYGYVSNSGGPLLERAVTVRNPTTKKGISTSLMKFWLAQMALQKPAEWKGFIELRFVANNVETVRKVVERDVAKSSEPQIGDAGDFDVVDPIANHIDKVFPRKCFAAQNGAGRNLVLGAGADANTSPVFGYFPPPDLKLLDVSSPQVITQILNAAAPGSGNPELQKLEAPYIPSAQISLSQVLNADPSPGNRALAASALGALPTNISGTANPSALAERALERAFNDRNPLVKDAAALSMLERGSGDPRVEKHVGDILNSTRTFGRQPASTTTINNVTNLTNPPTRSSLVDSAADRLINKDRLPPKFQNDPRWGDAMVDRAVRKAMSGEAVDQKSMDRLLQQLDREQRPEARSALVKKIADVWENNPDRDASVDAFLSHRSQGETSERSVTDVLKEANTRDGSCKEEEKKPGGST